MESIGVGFGGGCHWCTEAVFACLRGIEAVDQGFFKSAPPDDDWSEGVLVRYSPSDIGLEVLIEIHLRTHASTSNHSMRRKYRSAVYVPSDAVGDQAMRSIALLQAEFEDKLVTRVLPLKQFNHSTERYQQYYQKHAEGAFCQRYIDPKLQILRSEFAAHVR